MYSALTNKPISFWRKCFSRYARTSRFLSAEERTSYIDKWFESIVKEESFYEEHAAAKPRRYFYNIDLQGRLFLGKFVRFYQRTLDGYYLIAHLFQYTHFF